MNGAAIQYELTIDSMRAHALSLFGIYHIQVDSSTSGETIPKENYRLAGLIVEAPKGEVLFKLTGPEYTTRVMIEAFVAMYKNIKKTQ